MAYGQRHTLEATMGKLAQHDFQDRVLFTNRHQGLGKPRRVRTEPYALSSGQDDCVHGVSRESLVVLVGVVAREVRGFQEPLDGLAQALVPGVARLPSAAIAQ